MHPNKPNTIVRRAPWNGLGVTATVAVVADRSLIAEAVAAALVSGGFTVVRVPWLSPPRDSHAGWTRGVTQPSLGLMMCDLTPEAIRTARWLVGAYRTRWLLLTDTPKDPLWGAMLELGVVGILPSSTGLSDLLSKIAAGGAGDADLPPSDRDELVAAWRREESERERAYARMSTLTPRESEVLRQLHLGRSVHQIADMHGVARSTVRSQVRAVLHKLGVSSQLAAAATFDKWVETGG